MGLWIKNEPRIELRGSNRIDRKSSTFDGNRSASAHPRNPSCCGSYFRGIGDTAP